MILDRDISWGVGLEYHVMLFGLKVSWSLYCVTTSISRGVINCFPRLWGMGISDAIFAELL